MEALKLLGGSVMITVLLQVLVGVLVYGLVKLISHCWRTYRTFRELPYHPNTHWLWGHAHLVCIACYLMMYDRNQVP